jgi:hypothetical protein
MVRSTAPVSGSDRRDAGKDRSFVRDATVRLFDPNGEMALRFRCRLATA